MLLKTKDGYRLWVADGIVVTETAAGVVLTAAGSNHAVAGTFDEVAGEFGFKPEKPKKAAAA